MTRKRRTFGPAFKAKVGLAAAKGDKTTARKSCRSRLTTYRPPSTPYAGR